MKKGLILLSTVMLLTGCSTGISQEVYDQTVNEKEALQTSYNEAIKKNDELSKQIKKSEDENAQLQKKVEELSAELDDLEAKQNVSAAVEPQVPSAPAVSAPQQDLTGWVAYDTDDMGSLMSNIAKGNVVYANGGYWASPEYAKMMSEEDVVYVRDVAKDNPSSDDSDYTKMTPNAEVEYGESIPVN